MILRDCAKQLAGSVTVALNTMMNRCRPESLGILIYHRIHSPVPGLPRPSHNVSPERLYLQLAGLQRMGWQFVSLSRVLDGWEQNGELPRQALVVTFDDVFESVYLHAWPILKELSIPATLFLSTGYLNSTGPFPFDPWGQAHCSEAPPESYRPIRTEQVQEMRAGGLVEIGAHTHTHQNFCGRPDAFARDLCKCVCELKKQFGIERPTFAYPFGRTDHGTAGRSLETAARRAGVRCALTTTPRPVDRQVDPFRWGRFNVYHWDTARTISAKLAGWYAWLLGWSGEETFDSGSEKERSSEAAQEQGVCRDARHSGGFSTSCFMRNSRL